MMKYVLIALWSIIGISALSGQAETDYKNDDAAIVFGFSYGAGLPGGDLKDRFGAISTIGMDLTFYTKGSFIFGIQNRFLFGGAVKEDVFSSLRTTSGQLLTIDGDYGEAVLKMRGFYTSFTVGKVFPTGNNRKTGILVQLNAGILDHRVRFDVNDNAIPQVQFPYNGGYDRKTRGFTISEFVGYQYMSLDRRVNFFGGVEMMQGFGKNIRPLDYSTFTKDDRSRKDLLFSFRIGMYLPFYLGVSDDEIFY